MENGFHTDLDPFARQYLTRAAERLDATVPCVPCGIEDYCQDLQLSLLQRKPKFDSAKAKWTTFVKLVIDHRVIELRHRCLRGRCHASQPLQTFETAGIWPLELPGRPPNTDLNSLRLDIAEWLDSLDPDEQKLCRALMRNTVAETERELNIPHSTMFDKIRKIRRRFEGTSLREYLPCRRNPPTDSRTRPVG